MMYFCGKYVLTMRNIKWIGIAAAVLLAVSCFMPWTYYPDLNKNFTGFFSEQNTYGRPGILLVSLAVITILLTLIPRIWAKYWNIFFAVICLSYAIKTFILFAGCYSVACPRKLAGIWLMLAMAVMVFVASLFPKMPERNKS